MKKVLIVIGAIVLLGAALFVYNGFRTRQQAQAASDDVETTVLEEGSLTASISAIGKVRPRQTASLSWQTTGVVEAVNVVEGAAVKAGEVLASLEQTSLPQNIILAQADLTSAQQALEDLQTQAGMDRVKAMQDIVTYEQAVKDAQYQLDNYTIPSNQANLDTVEALDLMKSRLDEARVSFEPYKYASSNDPTRKDLKEALDEAQADYNSAVKRLQYEYDLEVAQANLTKALQDYAKWKDGPVEADVKAAEAKIAAAQATLSQAWIEAPIEGTITLAEPQLGDKISSSTLAFQIDNLSQLFVDLQVSEIDINQVKVGQEVTLTFDAIRNQEYHGQVAEVSLISAAGESVVDYTVTVELTDPDPAVRPGMTSEVEIATDQRENVLLIPNQAVESEDGKQVVYVMRPGEAMAPVEVTLGLASETHSELVEGELKAGDRVVLNPSGSSEQLLGGPGGAFGPGMRGGGDGDVRPGGGQPGGEGGQP